jgi:hypothetical protein
MSAVRGTKPSRATGTPEPAAPASAGIAKRWVESEKSAPGEVSGAPTLARLRLDSDRRLVHHVCHQPPVSRSSTTHPCQHEFLPSTRQLRSERQKLAAGSPRHKSGLHPDRVMP